MRSKKYTGLGIMSGTSLDGLDLCLCNFNLEENGIWTYSIIDAQTISYSADTIKSLTSASNLLGENLTQLDYDYGKWIGKEAKKFIEQSKVKPDFIASHGHTIFHNPKKGYTLQIGKGAAVAAESGFPCISDFRSTDVCLNGQGAPLVPIGDKLLFGDFDICLNLGGIANLSYDDSSKQRIAFDICPCNMLLNNLSQLLGHEYDRNGNLGKLGKIDLDLLDKLNALEYYSENYPKSLGREWFEKNIVPILEISNCSINNQLRTAYEHIAQQISNTTNKLNRKKILVTGGGTKNNFLTDLIVSKAKHQVVVPDENTIDYKEALIFAFLGVLYLRQEPSTLASVTGAKSNSIAGCLYY